MTFGLLSFLSPWLLGGLLALPVIYWLLRTVPPRPRQIAFPATRILVGLEETQNTPARTPWWLTLIRMLAAALVVLALADPVWNPDRSSTLSGAGPVAIVVDNGWSSAARWPERRRMIDRLITEAESQNRAVVVIATASRTATPRIEPPAAARTTAAAFEPQPFAPRRLEAATALEAALGNERSASVVWLADGIDHSEGARQFAERLSAKATGGFWVVAPGAGEEALGLAAGLGRDGRLEAQILRTGGGARDGIVQAYSAKSQRLGEARFAFAPGDVRATARFEFPLELRNQVTRIEIAGERSAGSVQLLDARSQWQRVTIISGASLEQSQPLLGPLYYVERALQPFAEVIEPRDANLAQGVEQAIAQNSSIIMLADIGTLPPEQKGRLEEWTAKGGVLVRFAGPRLEKGGDDLLPAPLRLGGRSLGGALSWSTPQPLAPFADDSLFAGLVAPADVLVSRQVLSDPARLDGATQVWARLRDGTPLVTAVKRGDGHVVLFHVTANSDWSNLPLSGLFVEMLRRVSTLGKLAGRRGGEASVNTTGGAAEAPRSELVLAPFQTLDGFGLLRPPPPTAKPIAARDIEKTVASADNPPGYYGPQDAPSALNVLTPAAQLKPIADLPAAATRRAYESATASPLKPSLFVLALALLLVDMVAVLLLQWGGRLWRARPATTATSLFVLALTAAIACAPGGVEAQPVPVAPPGAQGGAAGAGARVVQPGGPLGPTQDLAMRATRVVTLGYVVTGDPETDRVSRMGLTGLGRILTLRTAIEPGEPFPVNIAADDIAFFPVLYWPVLPEARPLEPQTLTKIDAYMKQGGMIIFDTRDFGQGLPSGMPGAGRDGTPLQRLLGRLDIPRLEPVGDGHVLTKSFYLLRSFPGRWDGGQLWVEAEAGDSDARDRQSRRSDGVSSLLVTSNDFAAAWALDEQNRPMFPVVPGGEPQREMAMRTGINIVMYALTGNYKADQVHIPALLERLGQ